MRRFFQVTKRLSQLALALGILSVPATDLSTAARAAEQVDIAIISFSPYAPWYIVKEKGMAKDIDINIRIIEVDSPFLRMSKSLMFDRSHAARWH